VCLVGGSDCEGVTLDVLLLLLLKSINTVVHFAIPMPSTVQLNIWADGRPTPYHLTVARLEFIASPNSKESVLRALVQRYGHLTGRNEVYAVKGVPQKWGQNSSFIDFFSGAVDSLDDKVRKPMFADLQAIPGVVIDAKRYPQTAGLAPQHVDTRGQPVPFVGQAITFVIAVV
jgi:hypothetical protein